jgi:hypothetical protein
VFIKEIVPRWAIAWVANTFYGENYEAVPMTAEVYPSQSGPERQLRAAYSWKRRGEWHRLAVTGRGDPTLPEPASEANFIFEHYWGYTALSNVKTVEYQVEHPRWRVWSNVSLNLEANFSRLYGAEIAASLAGPPASLFLADGSPVVVRFPNRFESAPPR